MTDQKFLDLSRPFETVEHWKPMTQSLQFPHVSEGGELPLRIVERSFKAGCFEQASLDIKAFENGQVLMSPSHVSRFLHLKAWVQARRGHLDGVEMLNYLHAYNNLGLSQIADFLYVLRFTSLSPRPAMADYIHSALNRFGGQPTDEMPACFREHWGAYLVWCGQLAEAESILEGAVRSTMDDTPDYHRRVTTLANAKRRLGKCDEARALLEKARQDQQRTCCHGDLADFTLPNLAKVLCEADPAAARNLLAEAKAMQSRARNRLGLVRTLLLEARLAARGDVPPHTNEAVLALSAEVPSLATCALFQKIMALWVTWTHDFRAVENGDVFWGL